MSILVDEALRYCGVSRPDDELREQMRLIAEELEAGLRPRSVWKVFGVEEHPEGVLLTGCGLLLPGEMARRMLKGCERAALMAVTLGSAFDTALRALQAQDMARALMTDACGSAMVEEVCDRTELEISAMLPELFRTDRFSPGYGDLPLTVQRGLLDALDASRRTGITLTGSNLMNPSKSVTAVIGLSRVPQPARIRGCACCVMRDKCNFRKRGERCEQS